MPTLLPTDADNKTIPAVRLRANGAHSLDISDESVTTDVPFHADTRIISLYATDDVYIRFGDDTVTATDEDHFFPAGVYYDFAIGGGRVRHYTHIAALSVTGDEGVLYISEKE